MNEDAIGVAFVLGVALLIVGFLMLAVIGVLAFFDALNSRGSIGYWLGGILALVGGSFMGLACLLAWIEYNNRYSLPLPDPVRELHIKKLRKKYHEQRLRDLGIDPLVWNREGESKK